MYLKKIFNNKNVIVTGHTGFKGSWLTAWLKQLGANVMGISLDPPTHPSHFKASRINLGIKDIRLDIRDRVKLENKISSFKPNFIFQGFACIHKLCDHFLAIILLYLFIFIYNV